MPKCSSLTAILAIALSASTAQASPIDYTRVSDELLLIGIVVTCFVAAVLLGLGVWGLVRYRKRRAETGEGWPLWAVILTVLSAAALWVAVFFSRI